MRAECVKCKRVVSVKGVKLDIYRNFKAVYFDEEIKEGEICSLILADDKFYVIKSDTGIEDRFDPDENVQKARNMATITDEK